MRPQLKKEMEIKNFVDYYWLKEELQTFCKENELVTSGSKMQLASRIESFLVHGKTEVFDVKEKEKINEKKQKKEKELTLDTVITTNHRCNQQVRAFFQQVIPGKFHFSTYIQHYFKQNVGKTYQDVVDAWTEEEKRKKSPTYKKSIPSQFEYNQYVQDFYADPQNKGKTQKQMVASWKQAKEQPGSRKYTP